MIDLYSMLGLVRGCSHEDIREAYRRLSKTYHPDMPGGDAFGFAQIKEAHDILTDEEARKFYDETGQIKSRPVEGAENAEIYNFVTQILMEAISKVHDVTQTNIMDVMRRMLRESRAQVSMQRTGAVTQKEKLQNVLARMSRNEKILGEDMIAKLIGGQIAAVSGAIERFDHNL